MSPKSKRLFVSPVDELPNFIVVPTFSFYISWYSPTCYIFHLLFMTWNLVNGIRLTLNAHISQSINGFDVIQIGGDSLFKELSNYRSYAQFRWETRKLWLFYEELTKLFRLGPNRPDVARPDRAVRRFMRCTRFFCF